MASSTSKIHKNLKFLRIEPKRSICSGLREAVKYYFADFVRKGGGVPPKSVTYFLDQNEVFLEQKTQFLALFEEKFSGENP